LSDDYSDQDLRAFLDEALPVDEATRLEAALRDDETLRARLAALAGEADAGEHSLGAVWRRRRLTCADRSTLSGYVLGVLADDQKRYLDFHLNVIGCRYCQANLDELRDRAAEPAPPTDGRRKRIFDSSVGRLRDNK
jgi:hypothetical protein